MRRNEGNQRSFLARQAGGARNAEPIVGISPTEPSTCAEWADASTPDSAFQTCIDQFEIKDGNRLRNTPRACAVAAFVRPRFRTVLLGRHLAIVHPLLVAGLAAKPLLPGAGRLD